MCCVAHSSNVSKFHSIEVNVLSNTSDSIRFKCILLHTRVRVHTNFISPNHIFCCGTAQHSSHSHTSFTTAYYPLCSRHVRHAISRPICNSSTIHFRLMVYQKCIPFSCDTNILARKFQIGQAPSNLLGQDEEVFQCWLTHKSYLHRVICKISLRNFLRFLVLVKGEGVVRIRNLSV